MGSIVTSAPTVGSNHEIYDYKGVRFGLIDIGGQTALRQNWVQYYGGTTAVIVVIDSSDRERMGLVKAELAKIVVDEVCVPFCSVLDRPSFSGYLLCITPSPLFDLYGSTPLVYHPVRSPEYCPIPLRCPLLRTAHSFPARSNSLASEFPSSYNSTFDYTTGIVINVYSFQPDSFRRDPFHKKNQLTLGPEIIPSPRLGQQTRSPSCKSHDASSSVRGTRPHRSQRKGMADYGM